jgi:hypothetical protein
MAHPPKVAPSPPPPPVAVRRIPPKNQRRTPARREKSWARKKKTPARKKWRPRPEATAAPTGEPSKRLPLGQLSLFGVDFDPEPPKH